MEILVTGGAGFIGSHTADALVDRGHKVIVLDNLSSKVHKDGVPDYLTPGSKFIHGDVRDRKLLESVLPDVDFVFHFAAYQDYLNDYSTFIDVNVTGTALLYEVAQERGAKLKKIVVASSQSVYGEGCYSSALGSEIYPASRLGLDLEAGLWDHSCTKQGYTPSWCQETRACPHTPYGVSKYAQELLAISLGTRCSIPTSALRYSIVQGPRQSPHNAYSGACRIFAIACLCGQPCPIFEDGRQSRDFVNIEDVVRANLLMLEDRQTDGETYNVGGGECLTILDFANLVVETTGSRAGIEILGEFRLGDVRHVKSDISKIRALGWAPRFAVERSISLYVDWLKSQDSCWETVRDSFKIMREQSVLTRIKGMPL